MKINKEGNMYQPKESTRGGGADIPPNTGSSAQRPSKYSMRISVDTTQVDEALDKINQACEKAKELKQLLKDLVWTENVMSVKADDIAEQIRAYNETAKRCGVIIH